ncbi:Transmembrane protein involved in DMSP breakdown [Roseibacterium elongatum DSM 19469]|uniref:Transmembrane protein involved in DMSP breakdown n=1 Tax=Roseicyclus elongatus DSM 19469 TaxID=1294273 RepID=W8RV27_9RHOB|nr:DUF2182 domain-containing protein [Roseibacterium elongatum]AHM05059.1 Transmembrane protein involved in DMSP breakdown [Roseibacterium elongatum DSM 19469]
MIAARIRSMAAPHWLALYGGILATWALLWVMALPADLRAAAGIYGADLIAALCTTGPGGAGYPGLVLMWALMAGGMMAPTALPAFATYDDLSHAGATRFGALVAGYLVIWLGFAVLAAAAQLGLTRAGLLGALGESRSALFSGALLVGAGLYQFSSLKEACLSRCRAPLTFFMQHWGEGAFRQGLRLGADCLGCCAALMALAFVGGVMSLGFMALGMVMMALEKLPVLGRWLTAPLGIALIAGGIWTALATI